VCVKLMNINIVVIIVWAARRSQPDQYSNDVACEPMAAQPVKASSASWPASRARQCGQPGQPDRRSWLTIDPSIIPSQYYCGQTYWPVLWQCVTARPSPASLAIQWPIVIEWPVLFLLLLLKWDQTDMILLLR